MIDGKFKYHDKPENVKIKGSVTSAEICLAGFGSDSVVDDYLCQTFNICGDAPTPDTTDTETNCPDYCGTGQLKVEFNYESHSKKSKKSDEDRTGTGYACVTNNAGPDEPFNALKVDVEILEGPHKGYTNDDTFTGKKLKAPKLKTCNDDET